jgi:DNA-binding XRE family transcriptional regulator
MNLCRLLKLHRKMYRMTYSGMAIMLGIPESSYFTIENKGGMSAASLAKILVWLTQGVNE